MLWTIAGFLCVLIPVVLGSLAGIWVVRTLAIQYARVAKLDREGRVVKAWIVYANENLYKRNRPDMWWNALLVCTLEDIPDLDATLERWAEGIRRFRLEDKRSHEDRAISDVLRTEIAYPHPIRIPKRISGRHEGYFIGLAIHCSLLPGGRLRDPYVYCRFYKGEERDDGEGEMVAYPQAEEEEEE